MSITLCVIGENPFGKSLKTIENKYIKNRTIAIKNIESKSSIKGCNILFIPSSESHGLQQILGQAAANNVLTIGDTEGFEKRGVIINMFVEADRIRFNIDIDAAERSGFKISSKLLKLAKNVYGSK